MPDGYPEVADVARVILSRTKVRGGGELGTFDATTRPTADQVDSYIQDAADEVLGEVGVYDTDGVCAAKVTRAIAILAAANIELAFWPEQTTTRAGSMSPYQSLMERYKTALEQARSCLIEVSDGGEITPGGGMGAALTPRATFPANEGGMIGNGSEWKVCPTFYLSDELRLPAMRFDTWD